MSKEVGHRRYATGSTTQQPGAPYQKSQSHASAGGVDRALAARTATAVGAPSSSARPGGGPPRLTVNNFPSFPTRIKRLPPDANTSAAVNTKLYQFQEEVLFACARCRRDGIQRDTVAVDLKNKIILCTPCFTRIVRPRTYKPSRVVPFPSLLSWLNYRPSKVMDVSEDVMGRPAEAVAPSGNRMALPMLANGDWPTSLEKLPAIAMRVVPGGGAPAGGGATTASTGAAAGGRHPCLRVWGVCQHGETCLFRNAPADLCLAYLMGLCRGDRHTKGEDGGPHAQSAKGKSHGRPQPVCRLLHQHIYDLPGSTDPAPDVRYIGELEGEEEGVQDEEGRPLVSPWERWIARRRNSPNSAEWLLWNNGALKVLFDVYVPARERPAKPKAAVVSSTAEPATEPEPEPETAAPDAAEKPSVKLNLGDIMAALKDIKKRFTAELIPREELIHAALQLALAPSAQGFPLPLRVPVRERGSVGLLSATAPVQVARLPPSTAPVVTHTGEYAGLRREYALLSRADFIHRVHGFSRAKFDARWRPQVHAYLTEALERRMADVPAKTMHDMTHLAHVAGFHELCIALYHAKRRLNAHAPGEEAAAGTARVHDYVGETSTARSGQGEYAESIPGAGPRKIVKNFLVSSYVVESAYVTESVAELVDIASYCAWCARQDLAAGTRAEVMTVFSLLRCLWRAVCLSELLLEREVAGGGGGPPSPAAAPSTRALTSATALAAARDILRHSVYHFVRESGVALSASATEPFLRAVQRAVKYDASGDDGEMLFYRRCLRSGFLVPPSARLRSRAVDGADVQGGAGAGLMHHVSDLEMFYATLIDTCVAGRHANAALSYYEDARESVGLTSRTDAALRPCSRSSAGAVAGGEGVRSTEGSGADHADASPAALSEYVLYRLLAVVQQRRDNRRIVQLARTVLWDREASAGSRDATDIGISVWSVFLISAGEARAADVALAAFHSAREKLQRGTSGLPSAASAAVSSPGAEANERRSTEYLLQTALSALSKCQLPRFEEEYLLPSLEAGHLHGTREFYYCCLLQDAHNSVNPLQRADDILHRMAEEGVPHTAAVSSRLLKLYLRCEAPQYLDAYRDAVARHGLHKRSWLDGLIVWADRRRYFLSQEDRAFILAEARAVKGGLKADAMGGLRTQLSLLEHDYTVQPREYVRVHGGPPPREPTVLDSRMHFLLRRPENVLRGIAGVAGGPVVGQGRRPAPGAVPSLAAYGVLGDPLRSRELAARLVVAGVAPLGGPYLSQTHSSAQGGPLSGTGDTVEVEWQDEATRLYLGEMLEGLQRSCNHIS